MLEKKIINGSNLIIKLGTKILDKIKGLKILASDSLKNSISSNKFKIKPNP
jgi:hypothetical protein